MLNDDWKNSSAADKQAIIDSGCLTRIRDVERIPFPELDISDVRVTHEKWNWKQGNQ